MGRLKSAPAKLGAIRPRLGAADGDEAARTRRRDATQPWRAWYKSARWQRLRCEVLKRDGFRCRQTGALLIGKHPAPDSPVVDHIRPHRGDADLFWDEDNLQAVSKAWHDSVKQRIERATHP